MIKINGQENFLKRMATRYYDRQLECGCMISSDGGGGLMPCHYGYGCELNNECGDCIKQAKLCAETWKKWKKTDDYQKFCEEVQERNG